MKAVTTRNGKKAHAVFVPYPLQGHIKPMLQLAKLLHHSGFHITFVNTEFNHNRLIKSKGVASLSGLPDFNFAAIPDGLPPSNPDASQDILVLNKSITTNFLAPFMNLIASLNEKGLKDMVGPVTCIVSDAFTMKFTVAAAEELRLPIALFFTMSSSAIMTFRHFRTLKDQGYLADEAYLNTVVDWASGIKEIRVKDFPSFKRINDENDFVLNFTLETTETAPKDTPILFHTFDTLEGEALEAMSSYHSHIYTVGPLDLLLKQLPEDPLGSMDGSLWKQDTECLQWLDMQKPNSVIYVSVGSIAVMTPQQILEFGWGLANSKHPFLWVIRPDLVIGDSAIFPVEFVNETRERGQLVSWCPQEEVLNHPSIGGFLTHCGWNSTIESISAGVPMLCWPFFADQQTNCWLCCKQWGIGIEVDGNAKRDGLEKVVRELMEGEKGKEMKRNVMELKKKAEEATGFGGSSAASVDKLVKGLLGTINNS